MSANSGTLEAMLDELKAVRRFAAAALVAAAIATVVALVAIIKPKGGGSVVEAERFVVHDKAGRVRAKLGVSPDETGVELKLLAPDGKERADLFASPIASLFTLFDESGEAAIDMSVTSLVSAFHVDETRSGNRFAVSVRDGKVELGLAKRDGGNVKFAVGDTGAPYLALFDKHHQRIGLAVDETAGASALTLSDQDGQERAILGSTELETPKTGETERTAESSLVLFDKQGQVMFQAPHP
jgi:hypothetical protein